MLHLKENKVKSILYILFMCIWIYAQYYKGVYTTNNIYGSLNTDRDLIILINVLTAFLFFLVLSFKGFKAVLIGFSIILSLITLGDVIYGRYYYMPLSVSLIHQINLLDSLMESIVALIIKRDILLFADVIILLLFTLYLKDFNFKIKYRYRLSIGVVFLLIFFSVSMSQYQENFSERYTYNKREIGEDLGVYTYHYLDIRQGIFNLVSSSRSISKDELELLEKVKSPYSKTEYTGLLSDKNLIVIQLEAFQNFVINEEVNGIEITPNLNNLIKNNSIYASNMYYETANGNTVDAELLANTSMIPTMTGSAYYLYPSNAYFSMANLLKDKGYVTNSFHAYENTFWNREIMHKNLGYDKFHSVKDFEYDQEDIKGWSLNDKKFLKDSIDKTLNIAEDNKFYSYMITLSSHYPYEAFYNGNYTWALGRTEGEVPLFERYLNSLQYVDYVVGDFIDYLKELGIYEDTVIVIFGDHGGLFNDERADMTHMLGKEPTKEQYAKLETVPFIIHNPAIEKSIIIDKVSGQKDIMPTIADLMDIKIPYTFSNNILEEDYKGVAIKRFGDIYTNDFIYLADEATFYYYETLDKVEDGSLHDEYLEIVLNSYDILKANDLVYKYDYLKRYQEGK